MYTHVYICIHITISIYINTCVHAYVYMIQIQIHMHIYRLRTYIYVIYIYIYMHIQIYNTTRVFSRGGTPSCIFSSHQIQEKELCIHVHTCIYWNHVKIYTHEHQESATPRRPRCYATGAPVQIRHHRLTLTVTLPLPLPPALFRLDFSPPPPPLSELRASSRRTLPKRCEIGTFPPSASGSSSRSRLLLRTSSESLSPPLELLSPSLHNCRV